MQTLVLQCGGRALAVGWEPRCHRSATIWVPWGQLPDYHKTWFSYQQTRDCKNYQSPGIVLENK